LTSTFLRCIQRRQVDTHHHRTPNHNATIMITKSSLAVIKPINNVYPMRKREFINNCEECQDSKLSNITQNQSGLDELFKDLEVERLACNMELLKRSLKQVLVRCSKVLDQGSNTTMNLPTTIMNHILYQMVTLAEQEPYGVKGGTLVVMFSPPSTSPTFPTPIKIGRFPLDPTKVSTYELHLTLQENCAVKVRLANLIRKVQGKVSKLVVSEKFVLEKKKLYRSSTSMYRV